MTIINFRNGFLIKLITLSVILILSGCVSSTSHLTTNLKKSNSGYYLVLDKEQSYEEKRGPFNAIWKYTFNRGVYKAEFENDYGTFYKGPEACITQNNVDRYDGGIWIPKDKINDRSRVYIYFNYNKKQAIENIGLLPSLILDSSLGDVVIEYTPKDRTFMDDLIITNIPLESI